MVYVYLMEYALKCPVDNSFTTESDSVDLHTETIYGKHTLPFMDRAVFHVVHNLTLKTDLSTVNIHALSGCDTTSSFFDIGNILLIMS